ncbi:MAG: hypothetical protein D6748_15920 [Calditrichaeota bacterium]|nr:MAG: hypothetical protein D6748_15920 [Calditrichota bacterium]
MRSFFIFLFFLPFAISAQDVAGEEAFGKFSYDQFEKPEACKSCHVDFYYQWQQAMMSQAYTHEWDEIEYFKLAVPHAEKDEKVAGVKAGCNGCHAPISFLAGDTPPPPPGANSRANESVSCDVCHTIVGFKGDIPYNFNYISKPGRTKYGPKPGLDSPHHRTEYNEFITTAEFCGTCHNEKSPYGAWVKATQIEWKEGPYAKQGVVCQDCHMPKAEGRNAVMVEGTDMVAQHLFHGAHDKGKLRGVIEMRIHPNERELEPGETVVFSLQLHNAKAGHKVPSGSAEERVLWVHVEAITPDGTVYHLPVDKKGFEGEEYTIASDVLAYQDMAIPLGLTDFKGIRREEVPIGDRIFRKPYLDPQGRMTIMQWNTASFGPDYRIGPRETKIETYTWIIPDEIPPGRVKIKASLYYRKLPKPVQEFLNVPEEESKEVLINTAETYIEILE